MAKSSRSSSLKKNRSALKKKVFGPVEAARNERLQARLLEIVNQPKVTMETEKDDATNAEAKAEAKENDNNMEVDNGAAPAAKKTTSGNGFRLERNEKQKKHKAARIQKGGRAARARNQIVFAKTGKAKGRSKR